jgi:hypothetical protein
MSDAIRLSGVTVNASDAIALARFYALITGGTAKGSTRWAVVRSWPVASTQPCRRGLRRVGARGRPNGRNVVASVTHVVVVVMTTWYTEGAKRVDPTDVLEVEPHVDAHRPVP